LDAAMLRQRVIANNIANVDTPNFKRSEVRFEELFARELEAVKAPRFTAYRTNPKHFPITGPFSSEVTPQIVTDETTAMNNNNNNVDIEYEMALMASNQIYYNTLIQQVSNEIKKTRTAIGR
jgi:flagellar basal-body rod protein FlgB